MTVSEVLWVWDGKGHPAKAIAEHDAEFFREQHRRAWEKRAALAEALAVQGIDDKAVIAAALPLLAPHLPAADALEAWENYAAVACKSFALDNGLAHWTEHYDEGDFEGKDRADQACEAAKSDAAELLKTLIGGTK